MLAALVREYIATGEPVASSLLVTAAGLGVSSATVRNILSRLEEDGYVQQPHTSAGRIPTDRGYRFYVDLLPRIEADDTHRHRRRSAAAPRHTRPPDRLLLPQVSHVLSQASHSIGFAVRPAHEVALFDRVEFIPLSGTRVLVVIAARGGHVIQKVIDVEEGLTADDLREAANYLNEEFSGLPLHRAREAVLERLIEARERMTHCAPARCGSPARPLPTCQADQTIYVEGAAALLDDDSGLDAADAAGVARDDRREAEAGAAPERVHRRSRPDRGDRRRAPRPESAAVQPGRVDLSRWVRHRHRRRHRTDAHALPARDCGRRRRRAGCLAGIARSQLAPSFLWLMNQ